MRLTIRRSIAGVVIAAGLFCVVIGIQRWFDARAAKSVVHALMHAVQTGDRETAFSLLHPDRRQLAELAAADDSSARSWQKQTGLTYHIEGLELQGDVAVARITVEKSGYLLQPAVHLRRGEAARWKIDRFEGLQVDPQYLKDRRAYERHQGEQLAKRLEAALQNRPGVTIERVSFTDDAASIERP